MILMGKSMVSAEDFLAQQGGYCQAESVPFCYCIPGLLRRYPENLWKQNKTGWWFGIFFMTFPSYWECHHPN